jgi:hypothetical protein
MVAARKKSASRAAVKPVAITSPGSRYLHLLLFFFLFTVPFIALHFGLLNLPYFWDEQGQFVPTALDLLRNGSWVAHSVVPNIHPPGVELYLVLWYKVFGYSIVITRFAMLLVAGAGLLALFLLSIELCRGVPGLPAFLPPVLLTLSPLFFMQGMMAQLDMPAMSLTLLALLFFLRRRFLACALVCVALVLAKETGAVTALVLFCVLLWKRQFRTAAYYLGVPVALGAWLLLLHHQTGYWTGDPSFAQYNVWYSLQPVHILTTFLRHLYYLFFAEFRWIGTVLILLVRKRLWAYRSSDWAVTGLVCAANFLLVTFLGGAALERYLLPILPFFYIVVTIALWQLPKLPRLAIGTALAVGLICSLFWNPPYPFPFENNYAMVDFVELQEAASYYIQDRLPGARIATAWPYTAGLRDPDFGFVDRPQKVVETNDFHVDSVKAIPRDKYDALVVYTRTWAPGGGIISLPPIREFLSKFYGYEPEITREQCAALGLQPEASWERRGQVITIYVRMRSRNHMPASENSASGDHAAMAAGS